MNAWTTLSRLIARCCFWPFEVLIVSRRVMRLLREVEVAEQLADRLRAHAAAEVHAEAVRRAEAVLELPEDLLVVDDLLHVELAEQLPRLLEPADALDGRLARVLTAALDVGDHLLDLGGPLLDDLEVLLARALDEAEVVRELAHLLVARVGLGALEHCPEEAVADLAGPVEVLRVDRGDELGVVPGQLLAAEQLVEQLVEVLRDRALLRAGRLLELRPKRLEGGADLLRRRVATDSISRGARRRSSRVAVCRTSSRIRFGSSPAIEPASAGKMRTREGARLLEARQDLILGPVRESARPELVVLVEALVLRGRQEGTAAREALVERDELLVAVDVDLLRLALDLVLEVREVLGALLAVDRRDDRRGEVEHLLELARCDVEEIADAARDALEEPDVRDRRREVDVPHALAPDLLPRHLDAAALADDPLVADALVLAAIALPVLGRTEDALAEQPVALGLQGAVVDGLRLRDLAHRPVADLLR